MSVCRQCVPNTLGEDLKNGRIWLKFCTLVSWVNICFFNSKILIFKAWERVFAKTRLNLWGSLETLKKKLDLAEILHTCSLSEYISGFLFFFTFQKIWFFGPDDEFSPSVRVYIILALQTPMGICISMSSNVNLVFCYQMLQSGLRKIWSF